MKKSELFDITFNQEYDNIGNDVSYKFIREGNILYIYFQGSNGGTDRKMNFKFWKKIWWRKPYKGMENSFRVHAGFLECRKQVEDLVIKKIKDPSIKKLIVCGYSHGAALATLCHECCWFHRPDLRKTLEGYAFEPPRVYGGFWVKKSLKERWANLLLIRNHTDIVTHLPPLIFGFCNVNKIYKIGKGAKYGCIKSHYPDKVLESLLNDEKSKEIG